MLTFLMLRRALLLQAWPVRRRDLASDPRELLQAVVAAGLANVERALGVHPAAVRADHELAGSITPLAPAANQRAVRLPDLDDVSADQVQDTVSVDEGLVRV